MTAPDWNDIEHWGAWAARWTRDYRESLRDKPVRAQSEPGAVLAALAETPPENPEAIEAILKDFEDIVVPGMTHWQHPRFFAYFQSNAAPASVLADWLSSALAAQCMLWQTSPAATEMEIRCIDWLRQAVGLPEGYKGVIQDSASSATLAAVLTMRERALKWAGNKAGLSGQPRLRVYCSDEVHTSIDRAIWIAGIGQENLVRIPVTRTQRGMDIAALRAAIAADRVAGFLPAGVIANAGGTSVGSFDDIDQVVAVARAEGLYSHVDAAWAGSAMICEEFRPMWQGAEQADSIVFNPHKWLGVQFDCSAHFVADPEPLVKTLAIQPEYLKTHGRDGIVNFSEWSVPLGRRFRALKIWFLLRANGMADLRARIRNHVRWTDWLAGRLRAEPGFEIVTGPVLSLFSFRHVPDGMADLDDHNQRLINAINDDGRIYLTQTRIDGKFVIRFVAGQFEMEERDADTAFEAITETAKGLT